MLEISGELSPNIGWLVRTTGGHVLTFNLILALLNYIKPVWPLVQRLAHSRYSIKVNYSHFSYCLFIFRLIYKVSALFLIMCTIDIGIGLTWWKRALEKKKSAIISSTLNSILNTLKQEASYKKSLNEYRYIRTVLYLVNRRNTWNVRVETLQIPHPQLALFLHICPFTSEETSWRAGWLLHSHTELIAEWKM